MLKKMTITIILILFTRVLIAPPDKELVIAKAEPIYYLTMEDVTALLNKYNVKYAKIVKAQAMLETGYLTSRICLENKNLFGMRYSLTRETTAIGERYYSAVYPSFEASVQDYKTWQDKYFLRGGDYYAFLQRIGYAEDQGYIKKLKYLAKNK